MTTNQLNFLLINEYLIIDYKVKNLLETSNVKENTIRKDSFTKSQIEEYGETINFDDIDFGMGIENLSKIVSNTVGVQNTKNEKIIDKKIIKIGKKKNI